MEGRTLFLVRGIEWDDISEICADSLICNSNPLLITLSSKPYNTTIPTLWAGQLLSLGADGSIAIDIARLHIALGMKPAKSNRFQQQGKNWCICYEGKEIILPDSKGMAYIQYLLLHPNKDVAAIELQVLSSKIANFTVDLMQYDQADHKTITQVLQRKNDLEKTTPDSPEISKLKDYLKNSTRGGKSSIFTTANEKARQTVQKAINVAIQKIVDSHDALGSHLRNSIKTGLFCTYQPDTKINWNKI
jgi:hypothetical protein